MNDMRKLIDLMQAQLNESRYDRYIAPLQDKISQCAAESARLIDSLDERGVDTAWLQEANEYLRKAEVALEYFMDGDPHDDSLRNKR